MIEIRTRKASSWPRALAALLSLTIVLLGCPPQGPGPLGPDGGLAEYQQEAYVPFRYGLVNPMGGNLHVRRTDLSIDTRIGTVDIGASWNSSAGGWTWTFEAIRQGDGFYDQHGRVHDLTDVADGAAIPGTSWVKLGPTAMKTKGGLVHQFGATGRLEAVHWSPNPYPRLSFISADVGGEERIVEIEQCTSAPSCELVYEISYDADGQVTEIEDRAARRAQFAWANGKLIGAKDGLDVAEGRPGWSYTYASGKLESITNGEGERTEFTYNGARVTGIVDVGEENPTQSFLYESPNQGIYRTRHWDATGVERMYAYDAQRRLYKIENVPLAESTTWTWSGLRPSSRTTPAGVTTSWSWVNDDVATETEPSGNLIQYTYQPNGVNKEHPGRRPILEISDSIGLVERRTYSPEGLLESRTNGADETWIHVNEPTSGTLLELIDPFGMQVSFDQYANHGHPTRVTHFLGTYVQAFDEVGNMVAGGDRETGTLQGGVVGQAYDEDRNLRRLDLKDGGTIQFEVRSDGRRLAIRRPGGGDHELDYDDLGRLVAVREKVDGTWRTTGFEHDASGRPIAQELANGMRMETDYDAEGRRAEIRQMRSGALEAWATMAYSGELLDSVFDSVRDATESLVYDAAGRLAGIDHGDGTNSWYTYDERSRKVTEFYVLDGTLVRDFEFTYDLADREVEVRDAGDVVISRTYVDARLDTVTYGNGLTRIYGYSINGDVSTTTQDAANGVVEDSYVHTHTIGSGDVEVEAGTTTWGGVDATTVEQYELAEASAGGVALGARVTGWSGAGASLSFDYDDLSNLLSDGSTVFSYNGEGNRLLAAQPAGGPALSYTYDEAGFVTSRGGEALTWTAGGRIASYGADSFEWDVLGRLLSATVNGVHTTRLFGGKVQGDSLGSPTSVDRGEFVVALGTGQRLYRHMDFRDNVKFTSDDQGDVVSHYEYSPWRVEAVHGADVDGVRFVGRREIGDLMILGHRIYDPSIGRFLSPDPILNDANQFAYTLGNPVWFSDPDGLMSDAAKVAALASLNAGAWGGAATAIGFLVTFGLLGGGPLGAAAALALAFKSIAAIWGGIAWVAGAYLLYEVIVGGGGEDTEDVDDRPGPDPGVIRIGGGPDFGETYGCSPTEMGRLPHIPWALAILLVVQAVLGLLLIRRRSQG